MQYPSVTVSFPGRIRGISRGDYFSQKFNDAMEIAIETNSPVLIQGSFYPYDITYVKNKYGLEPVSIRKRVNSEAVWVKFLINP